MVDIRLRIVILCFVVIVTVGYKDFPQKISEIQHLKAELHKLKKKKIIRTSKREMIFMVEDYHRSEEILQMWMRYLHHHGVYIKKLKDITHDNKEGFVKTDFSLQIMGDFIPLLMTLFDFHLPILLHYFGIVIENGVASMTTKMSILHIKTQHKNLMGNVGTVRNNNEVFNIHISPDDKIEWRKI